MENTKKITRKEYVEWILSHENQDYEIHKVNDDLYELKTKHGTASIHLVDIDENTSLAEFTIEQKKDGSVKYYLHFQILEESHAKQMYNEMAEALLSLKNHSSTRVLLSCSAGLTTGMFADKLNESAELLGMDYHFDAITYTEIFEVAQGYDAILIAPQIGFMQKRIREALPDMPVMMIPVAVFASYDTGKCLSFLEEKMISFREERKQKNEEKVCSREEYEGRILSISVLPNIAQTRMYYRLYDKGEVVCSDMIIKPYTKWDDIDNIIDTVFIRYGKTDIVGVSVPATADANGAITSGFSAQYDLKDHLTKKYNVPVIISNSADAAAVGFRMEHPEFSNIIFHSQPIGYGVGDQGLIVNGQRVFGRNGLSGGVEFFIRRMQISDEIANLVWETDGVLELVTKSLLPAISLVGPEAVAIRSPLTPDMSEVKKKLSSFLPERYMPEFFFIQEAHPYIMDGQMKICLEAMNNNK